MEGAWLWIMQQIPSHSQGYVSVCVWEREREKERENMSVCVASQLDWSIQASWVLQCFSSVIEFGVIAHSRLIYKPRVCLVQVPHFSHQALCGPERAYRVGPFLSCSNKASSKLVLVYFPTILIAGTPVIPHFFFYFLLEFSWFGKSGKY